MLGTVEYLYEQFLDVQLVASIMMQHALTIESIYIDDLRDRQPKGHWNQYESGVVLELSDGIPYRIYTSCGNWDVCEVFGPESEVDFLQNERLKLIPYKEDRMFAGIKRGPAYSVLEIDGRVIPPPLKRVRPLKPQQYLALWQTLLGKYAAQQIGGRLPLHVQIKALPMDRRLYRFRNQHLIVGKVTPDGVATGICVLGRIVEFNLSDAVLFSSGLIK
jgi:hypothetical protein